MSSKPIRDNEAKIADDRSDTLDEKALVEQITESRLSEQVKQYFQFAEVVAKTEKERIERALRSIDDYAIDGELGRGGQGLVYKAVHQRLSRETAIKVLSTEHSAGRIEALQFSREISALGSLDHPHIVRAYDAREVDGILFLAMEYVPGNDLGVLLKHGPVDIETACRILHQAAMGLQHAHENGFVHRDVKPKNLLMTPDGVVKLLDLGLAFVTHTQVVGDTDYQNVAGTPDYMAPEQWEPTATVDSRADIYALGCTLYYLIYGNPPFAHACSMAEKRDAHRNELIPECPNDGQKIPAELSLLLQQMLAKSPADRPRSAKIVADRLKHLINHEANSSQIAGGAKVRKSWTRMFATLSIFTIVTWLAIMFPSFSKQSEETKTIANAPTHTLVPTSPPKSSTTTMFVADSMMRGHDDIVRDIKFLPDGQRAASIGWDGVLRLWDIPSSQQIHSYKGHRNTALAALAVSPDGRFLASGGSAWDVIVWDVTTQRQHSKFQVEGGDASVKSISFTKDNRSLLVSKIDGLVRLVDIESGVSKTVFEHSAIYHSELLEDQRLIIGVTPGKRLNVWNLSDGQLLKSTDPILKYTYGMISIPQSSKVATCGEEGHVSIWDLETMQKLLDLEGHTGIVYSLDVSADGQRLVSGGDDKTVRVWSIATGEELYRIECNDHVTNHVAISPDGHSVLTGGGYNIEKKLERKGDYQIRIWKLPTGVTLGHDK